MQRNYRFLWLALIPLGAVGALATGMVPLPWQFDAEQTVQTPSKQAESPAPREPETKQQAALQPGTPKPARAAQALDAGAPSDSFGVDVARISMVGSSVIAGYGKPGSTLTVLADGKPLGVVIADAAGDWVLITSHKFASLDPSISLKAGDLMRKVVAAVDEAPKLTTQPAATLTTPAPPAPAQTAAAVTKQMMQRLKKLTQEAKAEAAVATAPEPAGQVASYRPSPETPLPRDGVVTGSVATKAAAPARTRTEPSTTAATPSTPAPSPPAPRAKTASGTAPAASAPVVRTESPVPSSSPPAPRAQRVATAAPTAAAAPSQPGQPIKPAPVTDSLPVPVQFVYRKAELTEQGREAANLLLAYFMAKKFEVVKLSGHADERGTERANHTLSNQRLLRIRDLLRSGGFQGRIELVPKGETEKYQGVDRSLFQPEELYQLDRRVEVMSAR